MDRRRLLRTAVAGGAGVAGATLLACGGGTNETGQAPSAGGQAGAQAAGETPQTGGTLNVYIRSNYPLDPQKVSALAQEIPGTAMSRLFRYKTGPDPKVITDHDVEPDLALSVESRTQSPGR